jgi:MPBQ/MSBQ methyltransferase
MSEASILSLEDAQPKVSRPRFLPSFATRLSPRRVKVSTSLRFFHEVLGLDYLNYGLWDGEPLDLAGLRAAQERYARTLIEWIPPGIDSVLDIGAGSGALSQALAERGFDVEGLSPDPYQAKVYRARARSPFHLVRFQEFSPTRRYDLVVMSESAQYIWLESLFPAVRRATPGGFLLIADYFRSDPEKGSGHLLAEFREGAATHGFELQRELDVTEAVLPTLELAKTWIDRYIEPTVTILENAAATKYPRLFPIVRRLFVDRLTDFAKIRRLVDADLFRHSKRYLLLLYRVAG